MWKRIAIELLIIVGIFLFGIIFVEVSHSIFSGPDASGDMRIIYAVMYLCCVVWVVGARIVHAIKKDK